MHTISPFLLFTGDQHGRAEEAVMHYTTVFEDARIVTIEHYGAGEDGPEGTVKLAVFELDGTRFRAIDSVGPHAFGFTPAISLFVDCKDEEELNALYHGLMEDGRTLMEIGDYGFSQRFGWVEDKFGVSWQLNLP